MRDHRGRVEAIQVDLVVPVLLRAFSTTPAAREARPHSRGCRGCSCSSRGRVADVLERGRACSRRLGRRRAAARALRSSARRRAKPPACRNRLKNEGPRLPQNGIDPLVGNGLGSPLCRGSLDRPTSRRPAGRNCTTSGFVASAAPTGNYGLDVHIDTGVLGLSSSSLMSAVQDLLVSPLWMALVWAVHALCVMLEWCFTLTCSTARSAVGSARAAPDAGGAHRPMDPVSRWPARSCVYDGLVRRRVADTLGQALMMAAMMVAGLWAIADPGGTVGALGSWANEASLGTLAVAADGAPRARPAGARPEHAGRFSRRRSKCRGATWSSATSAGAATRRGSNRACVRPRLRIAAAELWPQLPCGPGPAGSMCPRRGVAGAARWRDSAQLLRRGAQQRRDLPGAPGQRRRAQLDQRRRLAAARDLSEQRRHAVSRVGRSRGRVSNQRRHVVAHGRAAADRRRRARHGAAARLHRRAPAQGRAVQPALPPARPDRGARSGSRRNGACRLPAVGRPAARRGRLQAPVLVSARGGARCAGVLSRSDRARLVDAVAADVRVLVGRLRPQPSGARDRAGRGSARARAASGHAAGRRRRGAAKGDHGGARGARSPPRARAGAPGVERTRVGSA